MASILAIIFLLRYLFCFGSYGLFTSGLIPLDAAILQLSPPDRHACCTLGTSVDAAKAPADSAKMVLAEINDQMPRTHGNTVIPFERVKAFAHTNRPLAEHVPEPETEVEARIGEIVADLVEDRSCLQMGIGVIPDAVLRGGARRSCEIINRKDRKAEEKLNSNRRKE